MSSTDRQNNLLIAEDWQKIYQSFKNADFQSYDFANLRRTMIDYIRTNYPEDFNDYIESSEYLALIDLIAYVGQSVAFRVDLNARENFLELANRRDSVLRLARMIGYNASRTTAANGLLKFNTVQTTESVLDSNGRNLAGQFISWNDASNSNWYNQFITVINAALPATNQFGNPVDSATIYGIPTAQYRFNANNNNVPIYSFNKTIAGRGMNFEITSTTFANQQYIYEEPPMVGNKIACVYTDDGYGASSSNTGFFFNFTQGTLSQGTFTVSQPTANQTIDINTQNINNTDVWLYSLNQSTGLEYQLWTQVPALTGNNIIYNSINSKIKNIYSIISRAGDAISLAFSDGTFGNLPIGNFRVYYRVSNGLSYTVNPTDIINVIVNIPYIGASGSQETLSVGLNLVSSVTNASTTESNSSVKTNAPQTYYTQNRMITGEDYNISPLSANLQIAKVKSINRTSSGISRYFDLTDPTGKYSSTTLFADDGIIYQDEYTSAVNFTYVTQTDIEGVIYNTLYDILTSPDLQNFYYANFIDYIGVSLNVSWYTVTTDSNTVSGFLGTTSINTVPYKVGSYTTNDLKYLTAGALVKFVAPNGYYFNTLASPTTLTAIPSSGIPEGGTAYLWASVISVNNDGTGNGLGVVTINNVSSGPIVLDKVISNTTVSGLIIAPIVTQIIPKFVTTITPSVITTMIDLIFANNNFGLRYDVITQSWQIIFPSNLNSTSIFNLTNQGSQSNLQLDSSWLILFTTDTETYTITTRKLRYIFESDKAVTFYFDSSQTIYDSVSSATITDTIKILGINKQPGSTTPFTQDLIWRISSEYFGQDGYIDPKKLVITFLDSNGTGIADNPQLFLDIVNPSTNTYIVEQLYSISEGQEDYEYVQNNPLKGPVIIVASQAAIGSLSNYADGTYFYTIDTDTVFQLNLSLGQLLPSLNYKVYTGRSDLKFQYNHSADYDSRIDPGSSNIIDIYVLTTAYDTAFRTWVVAGGTEPLPPSSDELYTLLAPNLNLIKSISDEIIYHPVNYTLLFGKQSTPELQATFNVMINPNSSVSSADVQARILTAINNFFALENWNFGDTFYFTELSTYVMNQLAPDIINFAIVPTQPGLYFGSLFEIQCPGDSILISCATASDIVIVNGFTSSNLKTITTTVNSITTNQIISSAVFGGNA